MNSIIINTYNQNLGKVTKGDVVSFSVQITNNSSKEVTVNCQSKCGCTTFDKTSSQKYTKTLEAFSHHFINGKIDTKDMQGMLRKSFNIVYLEPTTNEVETINIPFELQVI